MVFNGIYNDLMGLMIVIQWNIVMGYTSGKHSQFANLKMAQSK